MHIPSLLRPGDVVYITAPARSLSYESALQAKDIIEQYGFAVKFGQTIGTTFHQWSAPDEERAADLNFAIQNDEVKAILMARGGYGTVRIIDLVDFSPLTLKPKWLIGFSDITALHSHVWNRYRLPSIHAPMPINFPINTQESIQSIFMQMTNGHGCLTGCKGRAGFADGFLVGGNLSVLYSLLGSQSFPDLEGAILVLEDLDEYLYHIDRMLHALSRAGVFRRLAGVVVGSFTDMHDNAVPFGYTVPDIIVHHFSRLDIPIALDANIGHHEDQRAFIHGAKARLEVDSTGKWQLVWRLT